MTKKIASGLKKGEELLVTHIDWISTEDSFDEGQFGAGQTILCESVNKRFDSVEGMVEAMARDYGVTTDKDGWAVFDDDGQSRIDIQMLVDKDNIEVTTKDPIWKEFKKGKARLWNAYIILGVEIVSAKRPSTEEMVAVTGFQTT